MKSQRLKIGAWTALALLVLAAGREAGAATTYFKDECISTYPDAGTYATFDARVTRVTDNRLFTGNGGATLGVTLKNADGSALNPTMEPGLAFRLRFYEKSNPSGLTLYVQRKSAAGKNVLTYYCSGTDTNHNLKTHNSGDVAVTLQDIGASWGFPLSHAYRAQYTPTEIVMYVAEAIDATNFRCQLWLKMGSLGGAHPDGPDWVLAWEGSVYCDVAGGDSVPKVNCLLYFTDGVVGVTVAWDRLYIDQGVWTPPYSTAGGMRYVASYTLGENINEGGVVYDRTHNVVVAACDDAASEVPDSLGDIRVFTTTPPDYHPWTEVLPGAAHVCVGDATWHYHSPRLCMVEGSVVLVYGKSKRDSAEFHVAMKHSQDGGATWSAEIILRSQLLTVIIPGVPIVHRTTGRVVVGVYGAGALGNSGFAYCELEDDWTQAANWQFFAEGVASTTGRSIAELGGGDLLASERASGGFQKLSRWTVTKAAPYFALSSGPTAQDDWTRTTKAYAGGVDNYLFLRDGRRIYYFGSGNHTNTYGRRFQYDCQVFNLNGDFRGYHPQSLVFYNPGKAMEYPAGCRVGNDLVLAVPMRSWFYVLVKRGWFLMDRARAP